MSSDSLHYQFLKESAGDEPKEPVGPEAPSELPPSPRHEPLSVALIGPDEARRQSLVRELDGCRTSQVRQFASYPPGLGEVPRLLEQRHDVILIDIDSDPDFALELVESIDTSGAATVMVFSGHSDAQLLMRAMRAGAREFLTLPLGPGAMAEALERASSRRPAMREARRVGGRLLAFMGAKGGAGVTMLATNYAVALAQTPGQSTLLIDLDLPLGDAALNLGIVAEYSTIHALEATSRLDGAFLSKLLVHHDSGLKVLAAPGRFLPYQPTREGIDKLIAVSRQEFDNVVVDLGSRLDLNGTALFREASLVYLVTQAGIPELRNSNRLISQYFSGSGPKLEVVLNRYEPRALGVMEEHITKALTRSAQWKIPNDYAAVRKMQINATPLVMGDSPIARLVRQMAQAVTGEPEPKSRRRGFSLFG
jgi:pilus assembly protein CpaE